MNKVLVAVLAAFAVLVTVVLLDRRGHPEQPGQISGKAVPKEWVEQRASGQAAARDALGVKQDKQILFGDLHVHTTYSVDAFAWSMPMFNGTGVHPPAEACDFARFCADLDFWASTEHAESLTPRHWRDIRSTVQQCNAVAGDPANPDLVSFTGWEWTQMGNTPAEHYGHKNVIFKNDGDDQVPTRPIGAGGIAARAMRNFNLPWSDFWIGPYIQFDARQTHFNSHYKREELAAQPMCPEGGDERAMPENCVEYAEEPATLFAKLDNWALDAMVIPHGNTWGYYTPPGSSWDKQLSRKQHDPDRQTLIEVFSGHGNSEEYRNWREIEFDAQGNAQCPQPSKDYLPSCWRAGEIIRSRCGDLPAAECEARVSKAQLDYLNAGRAGHLVVPGVEPEDWLDSGQCRDCYLPAFNYRPKSSTQYAMALSNFEEPQKDGDNSGDPLRFRFGFIASSDNHAAQPGTGYKQQGRHANTEAGGQDGFVRKAFIEEAKPKGRGAESIPFDLNQGRFNFLQIAESERQQSFFYTGGLVAVHSAGRSREQIWDALKRREVYGTSGEHMLLWFDLLGRNGAVAPMGSEVRVSGAPRFRVRAIGDFEQKPGCPEHSVSALGADSIERICRGECYNPSDTRKAIARIEVIRILPQDKPGEPVEDLIQDPWQTFACSGDPAGCLVEFSDPDPVARSREAIYYVRAVEKAVPTINAAGLRCEYNDRNECVAVKPCHGDLRTDLADDCKAPAEQRAWSSPIFVAPTGP
jgi:hypothetical protein